MEDGLTFDNVVDAVADWVDDAVVMTPEPRPGDADLVRVLIDVDDALEGERSRVLQRLRDLVGANDHEVPPSLPQDADQ